MAASGTSDHLHSLQRKSGAFVKQRVTNHMPEHTVVVWAVNDEDGRSVFGLPSTPRVSHHRKIGW
jgi:hypothetical protein